MVSSSSLTAVSRPDKKFSVLLCFRIGTRALRYSAESVSNKALVTTYAKSVSNFYHFWFNMISVLAEFNSSSVGDVTSSISRIGNGHFSFGSPVLVA